jgi:hypothetical protein
LVNRQLQHHGGELSICDTKTAGSVRLIALDRLTVTVLRRHHATACGLEYSGFLGARWVMLRSDTRW